MAFNIKNFMKPVHININNYLKENIVTVASCNNDRLKMLHVTVYQCHTLIMPAEGLFCTIWRNIVTHTFPFLFAVHTHTHTHTTGQSSSVQGPGLKLH